VGDSWFTASVRVVVAASKAGRHYLGVVKTAHGGYPKDYITSIVDSMCASSDGLTLTATVDGVDLVAVGYKYKRKVIHFLATKGGQPQHELPVRPTAGEEVGEPRLVVQALDHGHGDVCGGHVEADKVSCYCQPFLRQDGRSTFRQPRVARSDLNDVASGLGTRSRPARPLRAL